MQFWDWSTFILFLIIFLVPLLIISPLGIKNGYIVIYEKVSDFHIFSALILIMLILAFRSENIGSDLLNYKMSFLELKNIDININLIIEYLSIREPIFIILNYITGVTFNWNFQGFIFITSFIQLFFVYKTFKKLNINKIPLTIPFAFYFCFIYIRSFSMVRQSIALSIVLYAYTFLEEKNYKKFWFYSVIAIGVHYTAIITILIYFWSKNDKYSYIRKIILAITLVIVLFYSEFLFTKIFEIIGGKYSSMNFNMELGWGNLLIRLPLLLLILLNYESMKKIYPGIVVFINIYLLDIFIAHFKYLNVQFERFTMYTFMSLIFILPFLYKSMKKKYGIIISIITPLIFIIWFAYNLYYYTNINPYNIMPYETFLF